MSSIAVRSRAKGRRVRHVLVVLCHPVRESLVGAAAERTVDALQTAGHDVRLIDLYADEFEPVLSRAELRSHLDPPETKPHLAEVAGHLRWCDSLVFVYPTWFGAQPAMLKGWIDRMFAHGVAFSFSLPAGDSRSGQKRCRPNLRNVQRLLVVTTHGSPKWLNALQGEPGKRVILRGVRSLCHPLATSRWIAFYDNDGSDQRARADFLNRVEAEMLRL